MCWFHFGNFVLYYFGLWTLQSYVISTFQPLCILSNSCIISTFWHFVPWLPKCLFSVTVLRTFCYYVIWRSNVWSYVLTYELFVLCHFDYSTFGHFAICHFDLLAFRLLNFSTIGHHTINFTVFWNWTEIAIFLAIFGTFEFITLEPCMLEEKQNDILKVHFISFSMVYITRRLAKSKSGVRLIEYCRGIAPYSLYRK